MARHGGDSVSAHHEVREIRTFRGWMVERVYLYCPKGHEVVSAPTDTKTGQALVAGDYSRETCGWGFCGWTGVDP